MRPAPPVAAATPVAGGPLSAVLAAHDPRLSGDAAECVAASWQREGVSPEEVEAWLAAGATVFDAFLVAMLRAVGVSPPELRPTPGASRATASLFDELRTAEVSVADLVGRAVLP